MDSNRDGADQDIAADDSARLRNEFLANLSYEMRTAIHGMAGMIQMTLETDLNAQQRDYISSAGNAAAALAHTLDHVIDFSALEAGGLRLQRTEFDLREVLYDVVRPLANTAREKRLALVLDVHSEAPATVLGDASRLRQVVAELLEATLRFPQGDNVSVAVSPVFHSDGIIGLHFEVRGLHGAFAQAEFEKAVYPFAIPLAIPLAVPPAVEPRIRNRVDLGLPVANGLIGLMGGCLWIENAFDSGSALHFTATFETAHRAGDVPLDLNQLRGARVLIADPSAVTRRMLQQLLLRWQMRPTAAASEEEAIALLRDASSSGNGFELLLVDRHMLGMADSALAKEIREHPEHGISAITVLSSVTAVSITDFTQEISPSSYLVKPISNATLLNAVSGGLQAVRDERRTLARAMAGVPERPVRILVAEDNALNRAVAVNVLSREGYGVSVAEDGARALEIWEKGGLDLILMDIQMPGMGGLEATRRIRVREGESGGHVTILALTAHTMAGDRERCLEAGMDDYVSKPLHAPLLRKTVNRWLDFEAAKPVKMS